MDDTQDLLKTLAHFQHMSSVRREQQGQTAVLHRLVEMKKKEEEIAKRQARAEEARAETEKQRLAVERKRAADEESEREMRRQQLAQAKMLRNLIADATISLEKFRAHHL